MREQLALITMFLSGFIVGSTVGEVPDMLIVTLLGLSLVLLTAQFVVDRMSR